jgi:hypothetical protein
MAGKSESRGRKRGESQARKPMKLGILYVVVVGAILFWWLKAVKPKRRV